MLSAYRHSGASRSGEPGTHIPEACVYGFRACRCAASRNDEPRVASRLFQLDQGAAEILGVEEQHRLAVGADFRLTVAEQAGARFAQAVARGDNVVDLVAQMM